MLTEAGRGKGLLPPDFDLVADRAWSAARRVHGHLSDREARFLALLATATPAAGVILEIGSFKGRSTVALGTAARHYGAGPVVAVDPFTQPSPTDPGRGSLPSTYETFRSAVRAAGVEDSVEVHQALSQDVAPGWTRPLRVLWIDGDHTYPGAKRDFDLFRRHLAAGGMVAFHDALHPFEGPIRVFVEEVLTSDQFGPAGFCGSIAWAQHRPADGGAFLPARRALARRARRLVSDALGRDLKGLRKLRWKLMRALVPHGPVDPRAWVNLVASAEKR
jgi:MMP 1-O-methyltransferase